MTGSRSSNRTIATFRGNSTGSFQLRDDRSRRTRIPSRYFSKISELLAPDGAALIQGITMPDHRYEQYLEVDYIRTRVFPGSCVPSASAMIAAAVKRSDLARPLFDFGYHYARSVAR